MQIYVCRKPASKFLVNHVYIWNMAQGFTATCTVMSKLYFGT